MKLTAENVDRTFRSCFFDEGTLDHLSTEERKARAVMAAGVVHTVGFDPRKLYSVRSDVDDMLDQTPTAFGEGDSFLNFVADREGNQWTGIHKIAEQLLILGIAIGRIDYCYPRDCWASLPGGVPYFIVKPRSAYVPPSQILVMH